MTDEHVDELVDLYALGALESSEQSMVDEHLEGCERCRALLDESRRMAELLALTPEQIDPPPDLQRRVMARVQQLALAEQRGSRRRRWGSFAGGRFGAGGGLRLAAGFALLAALLLGGLAWQLGNQAAVANTANAELQADIARLEAENTQLAGNNEQLAAENNQLASAAAELQPLAELLRRPGTRLVALSDPNDAQAVRGYIVLRSDDTEAFVTTTSLQQLPANQTYQFWLVEGDLLESAGTFATDEQGVGRITIQGSRPLGDYDAVGISVEPAGGSEQPTDIVLVQPLQG